SENLHRRACKLACPHLHRAGPYPRSCSIQLGPVPSDAVTRCAMRPEKQARGAGIAFLWTMPWPRTPTFTCHLRRTTLTTPNKPQILVKPDTGEMAGRKFALI